MKLELRLRAPLKALLQLGLIVLTLEFCARTEDSIRWDAPFWGYYSYTQLATFDEYGRHNRPNAQFEKWKINGYGFRGPETTLTKPDSVIRIITVGASETFGLYESEGMEYPAQLQRLLDSAAAGRFEVLNAACPGMTPPRIATYFKTWLARFEPNIIAYIPQPSSYLYNKLVPDSAIALTTDTAEVAFQFRSWTKVKEVVKSFVPPKWRRLAWERSATSWIKSKGQGWTWTDIPSEREAACLQQLDELAKDLAAWQAILLIGLPPAKYIDQSQNPDAPFLMAAWRSTPRARPEIILKFQQAIIDSLNHSQRLADVTKVDLLSGIHGNPTCFVDLFHYNDYGASRVAEVFADSILSICKDRGLLSKEERLH